jgi:hypothetical protein
MFASLVIAAGKIVEIPARYSNCEVKYHLYVMASKMMPKITFPLVPRSARAAARGLLRRLAGAAAIVGLGLALSACTKCDLWNWQAPKTAQPQSCHDAPPPQ